MAHDALKVLQVLWWSWSSFQTAIFSSELPWRERERRGEERRAGLNCDVPANSDCVS